MRGLYLFFQMAEKVYISSFLATIYRKTTHFFKIVNS